MKSNLNEKNVVEQIGFDPISYGKLADALNLPLTPKQILVIKEKEKKEYDNILDELEKQGKIIRHGDKIMRRL